MPRVGEDRLQPTVHSLDAWIVVSESGLVGRILRFRRGPPRFTGPSTNETCQLEKPEIPHPKFWTPEANLGVEGVRREANFAIGEVGNYNYLRNVWLEGGARVGSCQEN